MALITRTLGHPRNPTPSGRLQGHQVPLPSTEQHCRAPGRPAHFIPLFPRLLPHVHGFSTHLMCHRVGMPVAHYRAYSSPCQQASQCDRQTRGKEKEREGNLTVLRFTKRKKSTYFPTRFHVANGFISQFSLAVMKRKYFCPHFAGILEER